MVDYSNILLATLISSGVGIQIAVWRVVWETRVSRDEFERARAEIRKETNDIVTAAILTAQQWDIQQDAVLFGKIDGLVSAMNDRHQENLARFGRLEEDLRVLVRRWGGGSDPRGN